MIQSLKEALVNCQNPIITTHKSPDGDAIGSSVALYHFLKKLGKTPLIVLPDSPAAFLHPFLLDLNYAIYDNQSQTVNDFSVGSSLLFCLDYNGSGRVGSKMESFVIDFKGQKAMIDHHPNPDPFCDFIISRTEICSTAQIIYDCIKEMDYLNLLDAEVGKGIYLGIMTDTGSFRFPSVDKNTHLI